MQSEDPQEASGGLRRVQGQQGCWERGGTGGPGLVRGSVSAGAVGSLEQGRHRPRPPSGELPTKTGETLRAGPVVGQVAVGQPQREDGQTQE